MRSLRRDLMARTVAGAITVLALAGVLLYAFVRSGLLGEFDSSLIDRAHLMASTMDQTPQGVEVDFGESDAGRPGHRGFIQVWASDGSVLYRSPSLGKADLESVDGTLDEPGLRWTVLPDGRRGREVGISFAPAWDEDEDARANGPLTALPHQPLQTVHMVVARHTRTMDAVLGRLSALLITIGLLAVAVCCGVLWLAVRSSLRPLDDLAGQIGRLDVQDLASRVAATAPLRELQPVSDRLNELLERLESAFCRERAFSSDVAHELRTPLAGLRSTIEVALSRERPNSHYREALTDSLAIAQRMEAMVERLLSLARLEAGQVTVAPEQLALDELIDAAWEPLAAKARSRGLGVERTARTGCTVVTDPVLLGRVLANVLDNAVEYADGGGLVSIETTEMDGDVEVRVANSCEALTPEEIEDTLKRFWRRDAARAVEDDHCGLGLPMAERIMATLGGSLAVRSGGDVGFEVTLILPKQPQVPS